MKEVKLELPWPPSINRIWKTTSKGGWYSTTEAKNYRQLIVYMAASQKLQGAFPKGVKIQLNVSAYPPDNRKRDLDNLAKVVCDGLQDAGVYNNDSQIKILHMEMREVRKGGMIVLIISRTEEK